MSSIFPDLARPDAMPGAGIHRILIVSDAWMPQVNGVVRTLSTVAAELRSLGHVVEVIGPDRFRTIPCPTYPDIRLSLFASRPLARMIAEFRPDALHIATEGPLGMAARRWALRRRYRFTTSFHTRFPEYIQARIGLPVAIPYVFLRRFHNAASGTLVATETLSQELDARGFTRLMRWSRGVDTQRFQPQPREDWGVPGPIFLYVGRIAVEKNITAFLDLDLPGSKVVVGGGPQLAALKAAYPGVVFTGPRDENSLARAYAGGDVFVFPSRTDTFGLVVLEALACGVPVAAYDVMGPRDILRGAAGHVGSVGDDLRAACIEALNGDRAACRVHAERFSWGACAETFRDCLTSLQAAEGARQGASPDQSASQPEPAGGRPLVSGAGGQA